MTTPVEFGGRMSLNEFVLDPVGLTSEADGGFCVMVPDLPACVSRGETREKPLNNMREAIQIYL